MKRVFAREKEKSGSPNRRARRILDAGAPPERESESKKKQQEQQQKKQTAPAQHKSALKMGELDIFFCVLFLSICGLKWLLFFEHQHNLYHPITHDENSQAPHHARRRRERRHEEEKKW